MSFNDNSRKYLPSLEFYNATTSEILETVAGLHPYRTIVRFEIDSKYPNVFHNYGHGGAGFTVAWGCALELTDLLR